MSIPDDPIVPLDPEPRSTRDLNAGRGRRRRVTRRDMIPHDAVGQAAFIFDLSRRAYPSFEFFVFSLACGAILGLGYLLDSQAVLLLGILVAPLMTPWVGFLLAALTGSVRFLFETFMALVISAGIILLGGMLSGFAARLFMPMTLSNVFTHSRLWIPELIVLVIGAVTLVASFARSENKPFLPSVVIAYLFFLPASAAGFGIGSGLQGLWPQGALVAAVHFSLASVFGLLTLFALRLRPSKGGIILSLLVLGLLAAVQFMLMIPSGFGSSSNAEIPAATARPAPSLAAVIPTSSQPPISTSTKAAARSATPNPTKTETASPVPVTISVTLPATETPTITLTLEPNPNFGRVSASEGGGANLRETPGGPLLRTLNNGTIVEISREFEIISGVTWLKVAVTLEGKRVEGWMLESTVAYATPEPNFEPSATPGVGLLTVVP